jgi:hypothetical protein
MPESADPNERDHFVPIKDFEREVEVLVPKPFVARVMEIRLWEARIGSIVIETDSET